MQALDTSNMAIIIVIFTESEIIQPHTNSIHVDFKVEKELYFDMTDKEQNA